VNAALRFSRDRRGYEHFYLVQTAQPGEISRRRQPRTRLLYWFRTPPNVKVGRQPFDEAARRALEARFPRVTFDWKKILATPIPSADAEKWRERRLADRASRDPGHENHSTVEANQPVQTNDPVESNNENNENNEGNNTDTF
jgi:hypothetical protein